MLRYPEKCSKIVYSRGVGCQNMAKFGIRRIWTPPSLMPKKLDQTIFCASMFAI